MMKRPVVVVDHSVGSKELQHKASARDWQLFMSPRISDTLKQATSRRSWDNDDKTHEQEFKKIYKEVEQLGTSQMSWKERKGLETKKILALGAKEEKGHKMPIAMGLNIKRKRERLEQQKLQEDISAGLHLAKRGKKKNDRRMMVNRGLKASEGVFKGGVLYVTPLPAEKMDNKGSLGGKRGGKTKQRKDTKLKKGKPRKQEGKRKKH